MGAVQNDGPTLVWPPIFRFFLFCLVCPPRGPPPNGSSCSRFSQNLESASSFGPILALCKIMVPRWFGHHFLLFLFCFGVTPPRATPKWLHAFSIFAEFCECFEFWADFGAVQNHGPTLVWPSFLFFFFLFWCDPPVGHPQMVPRVLDFRKIQRVLRVLGCFWRCAQSWS